MARSYTSVDPYAQARERAEAWRATVDKDMNPADTLTTPLTTSRKEYDRIQGVVSGNDLGTPDYAVPKDSVFGGSAQLGNELASKAAATALNARNTVGIAKEESETMIENARREANARTGSSIVSGIAKVASAALPFVLCDSRLKVDIGSLQTAEVVDELAELAFAVKELREHA